MRNLFIFILISLTLVGCGSTANNWDKAPTNIDTTTPEWLKSASIYQINTRQFTPEGTLAAAKEQLTRIKSLGTDVVWLMPIHPIGEKNRKGSLGSPYAVQDYFAVSPELGSKQDLKDFVNRAHELGMYVILDWVANHTAWDNVIEKHHPDWYVKDFKGDYIPTLWFDWSDVIDLNFSEPALQDYMVNAMTYWVEEFGIDGYRCDAAGLVPNSFWRTASDALNQIKPVFMLAEWEGPEFYENGFDATYAWSWWQTIHKIAHGDAKANALHVYYAWNDGYYPDRAMRLMYVSNHDANAWEATQFEAFGDALNAAITLSVISEGIPMIYNGQEAGNTKRLAFFDKDPIEWQQHPVGDLYTSLFNLKKANSALWNGKWGAKMVPIHNSNTENVLAFVRSNDQDKVVAVFNLSAEHQTVTLLDTPLFEDHYTEYFSGNVKTLKDNARLTLGPWDYRIFVKP